MSSNFFGWYTLTGEGRLGLSEEEETLLEALGKDSVVLFGGYVRRHGLGAALLGLRRRGYIRAVHV